MNNLEALTWRLIRVTGADRIIYLQGQLTQDIATGGQHRSLVLQPSGEVISDLEVISQKDFIDLVVPELVADVVLARLRRFLLRADVQFSELRVASPVNNLARLIESSWPSAYEWRLALPPHSFGKVVVDATVSFSKGCFTGQELVGRADARNATMPWRFLTGRGGSIDEVTALLKAAGPEGPQGVTSQYSLNGTEHWRGVAHRSFDPSTLTTTGAELTYFA
ncbi:unannotated protein [freshwater metagenome]|uniref:Unannotated protein n=1 Tax=freshwater metagenome TaxID=449393 RepID=A0A6J7CFI9_9ZZZZ|nr:hypothetical protein [Actinomycetota bacterium]MUH57548.1 hypothetical protein [Actinomycetota bacterium]